MDDEIATVLDMAFQKSNKNHQKFLTCIADYLRKNSDFFSIDYQQILQVCFAKNATEPLSQEIPLQTKNQPAVNETTATNVSDNKTIDETSRDLFDDENETQFSANIELHAGDDDSVIIPETQFNGDDSMNCTDVSSFLNERYHDPVAEKVAEKMIESDKSLSESEHDGAESGDFVQVAPNDVESDVNMMESQAIMANLDQSILYNFNLINSNDKSLSSTQIEHEVADAVSAPQNENRKGDCGSGSTTPDLDFDAIPDVTEKNKENDKIVVQPDTEDIFSICTQPVPKTVLPGVSMNQNKLTSDAVSSKQSEENVDDDLFDAPTQRLMSKSVDKVQFAKPGAPAAKKNKPSEPQNDSDSFFEMATQPFQAPAAASNIQTNPTTGNDDDIFEMATQRMNNDDIYEAATQAQPNDIFDAPTQRLPVRNVSKSPELNGMTLAQRRIAVQSQCSQALTPEWSLAKLIPIEPVKAPTRNITDREKKLIKKQKWLFNNSDESEDDDDDDDLQFDLTPTKRNPPVRLSLMVKNGPKPKLIDDADDVLQSNEDIPKIKSIPKSNGYEGVLKPKDEQKRKRVDTKEMSKVDAPAKRTRSLSIVLSRVDVDEHLKETAKKRSANKSSKPIEEPPKKETVHFENPTAIGSSRSLRQRNVNSPVSKKDDVKAKQVEEETDGNRRGRKRTAKEGADPIAPVKAKSSRIQESKDRKKTEKEVKNAGIVGERTNPSLSSSSRRQSDRTLRPKQSIKSPVNILFTKINPAIYTKMLKHLGGFIVDTPQLGSVLVCDQVFRTFKFLYAICRGIPIVTSKWLDASNEMGTLLPFDTFLLIDEKAEKRFHFNLKKSLEIARAKKLFENYLILATPNAQPTPNEIAEIVACAGGEFSFNPKFQRKSNKKIVLVTDKRDRKLWGDYRRFYADIEIVSSEGFMQSVVRQKITFASYLMS